VPSANVACWSTSFVSTCSCLGRLREIVDFCTVVEKDFARMGVDESFCYKKPKMGVSNTDEREVLRR
jgi:hypothetical protein